MQIRAKFKVMEIRRSAWTPETAVMTLEAVGAAEDNTFATATPIGVLTMTVTNPAAVEALVLGKSYYLDFIAAE